MSIQSGRALRKHLTESNFLEEIIHFGVKQVFGRNTSNYTCILVLGRSDQDHFVYEKVEALEQWRYGLGTQTSEIPVKELGGEGIWRFTDAETKNLFDRIKHTHPTNLGAIADISVGLQTSADAIYIFKGQEVENGYVKFNKDGTEWRIEKSILRPCFHDISMAAFERPEPNAWIIFPYELVANSAGYVHAQLIQPEELAAQFPNCWAYFNAHRNELENRSITGGSTTERQWYQYGRSQSLTKFSSSKIIFPVLSTEPRYAYDESMACFTGGGNGPYYMVRIVEEAGISEKYLLAVLNHPLAEAMIRTRTSPFRGGYYSHGKQFIEDIPIPTPTESERSAVEGAVTTLFQDMRLLRGANTPSRRRVFERLVRIRRAALERSVSDLYGLSSDDMEIVKAVPIPD